MAEWISPAGCYAKCGDVGGYRVSGFYDGNLGTFWYHSSGHRHWVTFDLGLCKTVSRIRIYSGTYEAAEWEDFDVYVGNNPDDLGSPVAEGLSISGLEQWHTFDIPDTDGRYLKLANILAGGSIHYMYGYEIEVEVTDVGAVKNNYQVSAGADDWHENQACGKSDRGDYVQTYNQITSNYPEDLALRFTGVSIPNGATVQQAFLRVYVNDSYRDRPDLDIYVELSADAADKTGACLNNRSYSTNKLAWVGDVGTGWKTKWVVALIQELVDHRGGLDNANILFFFDANVNSAGDGMRLEPAVHDNAAKLEIVYLGGTPAGGPEPYSFIM